MVPTPSFCPVRRWVLRALGRQKLAPHAYHQPPPPRCGPLCPAVSHAPPQVSPQPAPAPKAARCPRPKRPPSTVVLGKRRPSTTGANSFTASSITNRFSGSCSISRPTPPVGDGASFCQPGQKGHSVNMNRLCKSRSGHGALFETFDVMGDTFRCMHHHLFSQTSLLQQCPKRSEWHFD